MDIFTAEQLYQADKATMERQQISSTDLMERAAVQVFDWLHTRLQGAPVHIHLFCGIGNNGGDGLVVARHLQDHGYGLTAYIVDYSKKRSDDFLINMDRLKERKVWPTFLEAESELPEIGDGDIVVDAIFGIGLNRGPDDWVKQIIQHINRSGAFTLSIDVPSGLFLDRVPKDGEAVVIADQVLTFQAPKLVFFLPQTGVYCKQWEVLDIGLDVEFLAALDTDRALIGKSEALALYRPREKYTHKGTYGHALIIGGGYGKIGAVILAASACQHGGSGLVTAYIPKCGYAPMQTALPEAMVLTDAGEHHITQIDFNLAPSAMGIGIGMGTQKETVAAFGAFLKTNQGPLVIDADGLNILAKNKHLLEHLPPKTILTPHPRELERLIGSWQDDFDKLKKALAFSAEFDCVLLIKGAHSIICYDGNGYINSTGNPGMATGGSGDVLTGLITGLLAQGYDPLSASIFGTYLHGSAGDLGAQSLGYEALTASNIVAHIGKAYLELLAVPENGSGKA